MPSLDEQILMKVSSFEVEGVVTYVEPAEKGGRFAKYAVKGYCIPMDSINLLLNSSAVL